MHCCLCKWQMHVQWVSSNRAEYLHFFVLYWKDDLDELEVYGKEEQSGFKLTSYTFEVSVSMGYKFL